uniref:HDC12552 n=1 Tax=Drosophila melanogaster TaxID=7227 RepID=Q6IKF8_DROME|nr:TPA_inf: HDC12552 [Drosophila melanogaster]
MDRYRLLLIRIMGVPQWVPEVGSMTRSRDQSGRQRDWAQNGVAFAEVLLLALVSHACTSSIEIIGCRGEPGPEIACRPILTSNRFHFDRCNCHCNATPSAAPSSNVPGSTPPVRGRGRLRVTASKGIADALQTAIAKLIALACLRPACRIDLSDR